MPNSSKLCVSVGAVNFNTAKALLLSAEFAELRLDLLQCSRQEMLELCESTTPIIVTCRPSNDRTDNDRRQLLEDALRAGAQWVDIEIEAETAYRQSILAVAHAENRRVLVSYHNYSETPDVASLRSILESCLSTGADLVKIACLANCPADAARLLALYAEGKPIIVLGMGTFGKITRLAALYLGAPFTFVAATNELATAPGQFTQSTMQFLIKTLEDTTK